MYDGFFYAKVKVVYQNGHAYVGNWLDSKKHGEGKFYTTDGIIEEGQWIEGERDGTFIITDRNGEKKEIRYKNNEIISTEEHTDR